VPHLVMRASGYGTGFSCPIKRRGRCNPTFGEDDLNLIPYCRGPVNQYLRDVILNEGDFQLAYRIIRLGL